MNKQKSRQAIRWRGLTYREFHPKIRYITQQAIKRGLISKRPCVVCGDENVHAHHPDYSKPLEVIFVCPKHHYAMHRVMRLRKQIRKYVPEKITHKCLELQECAGYKH